MSIRIHFGQETIISFLLVLTRVSSTIFLFPLPGFKDALPMARIVLATAITFALMPVWPAVTIDTFSASQFFLAVLGEVSCGLILGLSIGFLHGTFQLAAQTISLQAGFSFASVVDPTSHADTAIFQLLTDLATGLLFFTLGIHRYVLALLAHSFDVFSPSHTPLNALSVQTVLSLGGTMFAMGVKLGLPVVVLLLLIELSLAILGRLHAQLQLMTLALPVKTVLSFAFFAAIMMRWPMLYEQAARKTFETISHIGFR